MHPYGIADLRQLWDVSRWWRRGDAVVGLLELAGRLAPWYRAARTSPYLKLALAGDPRPLPGPPDAEVRTLGTDDLPGLHRLYATDPTAGEFFHPGCSARGATSASRWPGSSSPRRGCTCSTG